MGEAATEKFEAAWWSEDVNSFDFRALDLGGSGVIRF